MLPEEHLHELQIHVGKGVDVSVQDRLDVIRIELKDPVELRL